MSVESIHDQIRDMEDAFQQLNRIYIANNFRFTQARDRQRFQARKEEYKKIREEAWRWMIKQGRTPTDRPDIERGQYNVNGVFYHHTEWDNPFNWAMQAFRVRQELRATRAAVQQGLPVQFVSQNLYLVGTVGSLRPQYITRPALCPRWVRKR